MLAWLAALCVASMMLHIFADVVLKYLLNKPIPGTAEVVGHYYMIGAVFLPLALIEIRNGGISVDLVYLMLGRSAQKLLILIAYLGQSFFFSLLAYQSFLDAMQSFAKGEFIDGQVMVTIWPATFFLPIGLGLATLISLLRIAQTLTRNDWESIIEFQAAVGDDLPAKEAA